MKLLYQQYFVKKSALNKYLLNFIIQLYFNLFSQINRLKKNGIIQKIIKKTNKQLFISNLNKLDILYAFHIQKQIMIQYCFTSILCYFEFQPNMPTKDNIQMYESSMINNSPPEEQSPEHNKLNLIRFYSLPQESEFKCHFTLKSIFMPRKESIKEYFSRLRKMISLCAPVSILQLSNVYPNELVDVDVGMTYDKDALYIINNNIPFKLQNREGVEVPIKYVISNVFKMYTTMFESKQFEKGEAEKSSSLLTRPVQKQRQKQRDKLQYVRPKQYIRQDNYPVNIRVIGVPKQYGHEQVIQALLNHPREQISIRDKDIRENQQNSMHYYQISLSRRAANMILETGFQLRGIPLLVVEKREGALKAQIGEYQIRVMTLKDKMAAKIVYNIFRKVGKIVNLFDFNNSGNNFLITFSKKKYVEAAIYKEYDGLKVVAVDKSQAFRLQRISVKSAFYNYLRSEQ